MSPSGAPDKNLRSGEAEKVACLCSAPGFPSGVPPALAESPPHLGDYPSSAGPQAPLKWPLLIHTSFPAAPGYSWVTCPTSMSSLVTPSSFWSNSSTSTLQLFGQINNELFGGRGVCTWLWRIENRELGETQGLSSSACDSQGVPSSPKR